MESEGGWAEFWSQAEQNLQRGWSWSGFERSVFFLNQGDARFVDIGTVIGADQVSDGRGLAAGDIDGDGDLDLVGTCSGTHPHVYVLRNDLATERHFLLVDLVPRDERSAAGAQLLLTAGGRTQRRDVAVGSGFLTQHALTQHFGLDDEAAVERLEVTWPDGEVQVRDVPGVDRRIVLRQADERTEVLELAERNYNATGRLPAVEWDNAPRALTRVEAWGPDLSGLKLTDLAGVEHALSVENGDGAPDGPFLLVNLWATWCANCKAEVPDLNTIHAPETLRVLGVSVDEDPVDAAGVQRVAEAWGVDYPVVHLTGRERARFEKRTGSLIASEGGLALPTSLVVDPSGKVLAFARGAVDVENLTLFLESLREDAR